MKEKDIALRRPDSRRDMISFISFAVGCMLGRYQTAGYQPEQNCYAMTEEGILEEFCRFVRMTYGEEYCQENLKAVADALNQDSADAMRTIRQYLFRSFYADHVRQYHKCPVYIMFDSGKRSRFRCLVYAHRLDTAVLEQIRQMALEKAGQLHTAAGKKDNQPKIEELEKFAAKIAALIQQKVTFCMDDGLRTMYDKLTGLITDIP